MFVTAVLWSLVPCNSEWCGGCGQDAHRETRGRMDPETEGVTQSFRRGLERRPCGTAHRRTKGEWLPTFTHRRKRGRIGLDAGKRAATQDTDGGRALRYLHAEIEPSFFGQPPIRQAQRTRAWAVHEQLMCTRQSSADATTYLCLFVPAAQRHAPRRACPAEERTSAKCGARRRARLRRVGKAAAEPHAHIEPAKLDLGWSRSRIGLVRSEQLRPQRRQGLTRP
jgi:hypothetical protein